MEKNIISVGEFIGSLKSILMSDPPIKERLHLILVTYNRVKNGLFGRFESYSLILDIISGSVILPPSNEEVERFFKKIQNDLEIKIFFSDTKKIIVIYGGNVENFRRAVSVIKYLSSHSSELGERAPTFFVLTCRCSLEEKIKIFFDSELQIQIILSDCGGFYALQRICDFISAEREVVDY